MIKLASLWEFVYTWETISGGVALFFPFFPAMKESKFILQDLGPFGRVFPNNGKAKAGEAKKQWFHLTCSLRAQLVGWSCLACLHTWTRLKPARLVSSISMWLPSQDMKWMWLVALLSCLSVRHYSLTRNPTLHIPSQAQRERSIPFISTQPGREAHFAQATPRSKGWDKQPNTVWFRHDQETNHPLKSQLMK